MIEETLPPVSSPIQALTARSNLPPPNPIEISTSVPVSLHEVTAIKAEDQMTLKALLDNFDPKSGKKYILIFDIDGTLRENDSNPYTQVNAIDPKIARLLSELNSFPNIKVVTLSSRPAYAITRSNIPKDLNRLCANGAEHLYPFDLEEEVSRISYDLWHPKRFTLTALYTAAHWIHKRLKTKAIATNKKTSSKLMKFFDEWINSKAFGIGRILGPSLEKNKSPDHVFYFGNSKADTKGMQALQELAQKFEFKASTIFIKDPHDSDDTAISDRLSSFTDTHAFLYAARNKLPSKISDNASSADCTVVTHNVQGNVIPLPNHYKNLHSDPLADEPRDRLHHNRIHTFQEFNGSDLTNLINEKPNPKGGYKLVDGLHVFWAPDFKQEEPSCLVDLYCDETTSGNNSEHQARKDMQYIVTTAPSEYFKLAIDSRNKDLEVLEPWFRIFQGETHNSKIDKFIHKMTGWGGKISSALAIRLKDLQNRTIQIVNFHLPAVMDTTRRLALLKNILSNESLATSELATILAGDFNPLDSILTPNLQTRISARSEEAQLEQVLKEHGFESPFRNKSTTHLDKRTFFKPLIHNLYRCLDLIAINKHFKFHDIDEQKISQKIEQYKCEPRGERRRLRKNLQYPSGVSVGKWHGSDHRKVTGLIDHIQQPIKVESHDNIDIFVKQINADPSKHYIAS